MHACRLVWLEALYEWLPPRLLPATDDIWMLSKGLDIQKKAAACKGIVPANRVGCRSAHLAIVLCQVLPVDVPA
jgi:hypothetical protein